MFSAEEKGFCPNCGIHYDYRLVMKSIRQVIREKEYDFQITAAYCNKCGEEVSLKGLQDYNVMEIDTQYRLMEGIVQMDSIEKLMSLYHIGKAPLSHALGFGEVTIGRYLEGQVPSKEYSDIMKQALLSPSFMKEKLIEHKNRLTEAAYLKAYAAAEGLELQFSVSKKTLGAIAVIFRQLEEVTPLALQKILYYVQGIALVQLGGPLFPERCEAWVHGPVYPKVYDMFKTFRYNPIEDDRFQILEGAEKYLSNREQEVVKLVADTFGLYHGKTLERMTHGEKPWQLARKGYDATIPSHRAISIDVMDEYFAEMNQQYQLTTVEGIQQYILAKLGE